MPSPQVLSELFARGRLQTMLPLSTLPVGSIFPNHLDPLGNFMCAVGPLPHSGSHIRPPDVGHAVLASRAISDRAPTRNPEPVMLAEHLAQSMLLLLHPRQEPYRGLASATLWGVYTGRTAPIFDRLTVGRRIVNL